MANPSKLPLSPLFIAIALAFADSARILDQLEPQHFDLVNPPAGPQPQGFVGPPDVLGPSVDLTTQIGPGPSTPPPPPSLCFFMHDILGGSHPSARVVTGVVATSDATGLPFSKPNNNILPLPGGIPLLNGNNHHPSPSGLTGGNHQPFVTAGQLPSGSNLQHLIFGSVTTIDDELSEGEELGMAVIGKAQGFYFTSSLDGTSQTIALTAMLREHKGEDGDDDRHQHKAEDTISFFGVHRTASPESQIAVVGGTGKYEMARGYATIETLQNRENIHTTDGEDTIVRFSVYLSL